jgi:hypothetical protein
LLCCAVLCCAVLCCAVLCWLCWLAGCLHAVYLHVRTDTTSVIGNKTVDWILKNAKKDEPFFVSAATRAPHAPYLPPPWYRETFEGIKSPRNLGSYNHTTEGKPAWMAANLPLDAKDADHFDEVMRLRWGALLAVDDLVQGVITALDTAGKKTHLLRHFLPNKNDHLIKTGSGQT